MVQCPECGEEIDDEAREYDCPFCGYEDYGEGFYECYNCGAIFNWAGDLWECVNCANEGVCLPQRRYNDYNGGIPDVNQGWVGEHYG